MPSPLSFASDRDAAFAECDAFMANRIAALREHGLSSCPQECCYRYTRMVGELTQAPDELMLFCGMAIGYADPGAPVNRLVTERMALEDFATFEGFEATTE